jgi:hypothetical protein
MTEFKKKSISMISLYVKKNINTKSKALNLRNKLKIILKETK